jgi:putative ABC transport system substrate-binding protein
MTVAHFADGYPERLPELSRKAVEAAPDLIVAGAVDAALELKKITSSLPIVSAFLADAVHLGLISSNAHPGGNVTGIEPYVDGLPAKQFEIARLMLPAVRRIGILGNLNDPKAPPQRQEIEDAARRASIEVSVPEVRNPADLAGAIDMLAQRQVDIAIVLQTSMTVSTRTQIAALTAGRRLPALYGYREHVDEGGLISYGVSMRWCCMRLATFVQKILMGMRPADLPVEFPPRLEMVINAGTARALGITIPQILLARADEVIE